MICVPITGNTVPESRKRIEAASRFEMIEIRLDYIPDLKSNDIETLLEGNPDNVIITDRKNRYSLIEKAINCGVAFVDLDIGCGKQTIQKIKEIKGKTKLIVSYHDYGRTDIEKLKNVYGEISGLKPDIIKIVSYANSITDNAIIFEIIKKAKKENNEIIALAMGEKGEISRILSVPLGAFLTYGSLEKGLESAPGQIEARKLKELYRVDELKNPKVFGLVGNPVMQSKGIIYHNEIFKAKSLNALYLNFLVDDLEDFIEVFKGYFTGISVTIPFKESIIPFLSKLNEKNKLTGAVNTVINKDNELEGHNSDVFGAINTLMENTDLVNKKILIIGAGGVSRAVVSGIKEYTDNITVANRTVEKAKMLSKIFDCDYLGLDEIQKLSEIDVLVNCTSVGMYPESDISPVNAKDLSKIMSRSGIVFDTVYNPKETVLLKNANDLGLKVIDGVAMFEKQAKYQSDLFISAGR